MAKKSHALNLPSPIQHSLRKFGILRAWSATILTPFWHSQICHPEHTKFWRLNSSMGGFYSARSLIPTMHSHSIWDNALALPTIATCAWTCSFSRNTHSSFIPLIHLLPVVRRSVPSTSILCMPFQAVLTYCHILKAELPCTN